MANIIGEPINSTITDQIKIRQKVQGSGVPGNEKTPDYHAYLNSKTAWFKLASATVVDEKRLKAEGLDSGLDFAGIGFAKQHVLYSGMSRVDLSQQRLLPRGTFDGKNNIWDYYDGAYTVNASADRKNNVSEFGLVPMPGVESVDVQCLNRGSIKKATIKIKCYSPQQFKIIDLLYLRIGYTVFLEWGWAPYLDNSGKLVHDYYTLIEQSKGGFFDWGYWSKKGYRSFLKSIERYRLAKNGNYDGLLCRVTNFSWTFSQDGSYDIDLQLITLGDVVESLKTNISPNRKFLNFITAAYKIFNDEYATDTDVETTENPPAPIQDWISAYFFANKINLYKNRDEYRYWYKRDITCKIADVPINVFGVFLDAAKRGDEILALDDKKNFWTDDGYKVFVETLKNDGFVEVKDEDEFDDKTIPGSWYYIDEDILGGTIYYKTILNTEEIFKIQAKKDMVYIHWNTGEDDEDIINAQGFYIRFGHLLEIINQFIIPYEKISNKPIINISTDPKENKMYIFPYQVSLDPRVCLISNYEEPVNSKEYYLTLTPCKILSDPIPHGRTMNIYLNCQKIEEIISNNQDDRGNLDLFSFLESICSELNKALGGVNNFEPVIEETTNTLYIVDGSYSEPKQPEYALELYGYNQSNPNQSETVSNFVRDFSIKTELTNDFATMATVGSTAGGYVKGTENTMFSKWNKGLKDRFKEKLIPADPESRNKEGEVDEPNEVYVKEFWTKRYNAFGLTAPKDVEYDLTTEDIPNISPEMCDKNVSIVTEFYKYCQSRIQQNSENPSSIWYREKDPYAAAVNGFIPISLSITIDGISGIKIYNEINVITRFLPQNYPDSLRFIIKGVNHKLSGNDWETTIETVVIAQNGKKSDLSTPIFTYEELRNQVREIISEGITAAAADEAEAGGGSAPTTPSSPPPSVAGAWKVWNKGKYITSAYELNAHHSQPVTEKDPQNTRSGGWTRTKSGKYVYDVCLFRKEGGILQNKPFVPSPVNGVVTRTSPDSSGNAFLTIKGDDGYEYDLLHMDNYQVKKGDRVVKGQLIARQSNVSPNAFANHLHIQMPTKQSLINYIDSLVNNSF